MKSKKTVQNLGKALLWACALATAGAPELASAKFGDPMMSTATSADSSRVKSLERRLDHTRDELEKLEEDSTRVGISAQSCARRCRGDSDKEILSGSKIDAETETQLCQVLSEDRDLLANLSEGCQRGVDEYAPIKKEKLIAAKKKEIDRLEVNIEDTREKEQEKAATKKQEYIEKTYGDAYAYAACPQCYLLNKMYREPTAGQSAAGIIQALTPLAFGAANLGLSIYGMNNYNTNYQSYLNNNLDLGIASAPPSMYGVPWNWMGGFGMGMGGGGFGYPGMGGMGWNPLAGMLGGGLGINGGINIGLGGGMGGGYPGMMGGMGGMYPGMGGMGGMYPGMGGMGGMYPGMMGGMYPGMGGMYPGMGGLGGGINIGLGGGMGGMYPGMMGGMYPGMNGRYGRHVPWNGRYGRHVPRHDGRYGRHVPWNGWHGRHVSRNDGQWHVPWRYDGRHGRYGSDVDAAAASSAPSPNASSATIHGSDAGLAAATADPYAEDAGRFSVLDGGAESLRRILAAVAASSIQHLLAAIRRLWWLRWRRGWWLEHQPWFRCRYLSR